MISRFHYHGLTVEIVKSEMAEIRIFSGEDFLVAAFTTKPYKFVHAVAGTALKRLALIGYGRTISVEVPCRIVNVGQKPRMTFKVNKS